MQYKYYGKNYPYPPPPKSKGWNDFNDLCGILALIYFETFSLKFVAFMQY